MSNYYNRVDAVALIELEIKANKEALSLIDGIVAVVQRFDGKVINKRFETALQQEVSGQINAHWSSYGYFLISYSIPDRSVQSTASEYVHNYIDLSQIFFTSGDLSICFSDGNRLIATAMIEKLEERRNELQHEICALKSAILNLDQLIRQHETMVSALTKLRERIPHSVRNYVTELHVPSFY